MTIRGFATRSGCSAVPLTSLIDRAIILALVLRFPLSGQNPGRSVPAMLHSTASVEAPGCPHMRRDTRASTLLVSRGSLHGHSMYRDCRVERMSDKSVASGLCDDSRRRLHQKAEKRAVKCGSPTNGHRANQKMGTLQGS